MNAVRVRFAPSPTGPLHIGGLRTALYNYLFARDKGGTFILRVEDTDQTRFVDGAEAYIRQAVTWAGLSVDEGPESGGAFGPYRQSERRDIYNRHTPKLIENGSAYYAFDTPEQINAMRTRLEAEGVHSPKYSHETRMTMTNSLTLSTDETQKRLDNNEPYTIRLKVDPGQEIAFTDMIRGEVRFNSSELDDKVLMKSDGLPTYHLANVIDDYEMKISHVIRGEEWLSSTAHHVLLYRAFGWESEMPNFAHLPLLLKPTGKGKLSKRDGQKLGIPVFPLDWISDEGLYMGFRELGFLPDATINFLAFLGWNPGTEQELFSMEELIESFDLKNVSKGGARFDFEKAKWYNQQYILNAPDEVLIEALDAQLKARENERDLDFKKKYISLFRPRLETLNDLYQVGYYFFESISDYNEKMVRKKWKNNGVVTYNSIADALSNLENWLAGDIKSEVEQGISANESSFGEVLPLLRIAVTGDVKGADLFESMELLGRDKTLERLQQSPEIFNRIINPE